MKKTIVFLFIFFTFLFAYINIIQNGDFETFSGGVATNWVANDDGADNIYSQETIIVRSGSSSQKIKITTNPLGNDGISQTGIYLENGKKYRFNFSIYDSSAAIFKILFYKSGSPTYYVKQSKDGLTTTNSTFIVPLYKWIDVSFNSMWGGNTGNYTLYFRSGSTNKAFFIDNFKIYEIERKKWPVWNDWNKW